MTTVPYVRGSPTSQSAAESQRRTLNEKEQAVLDAIANQGEHGATDDELEICFTGPPFFWATPTARARRVALEQQGLILYAGFNRKTRCGRWARVYVLAQPQQGMFGFSEAVSEAV